MTAEPIEPAMAWRAARHLTVCVRPTGISIPGYLAGNDVPLDLESLAGVEALGRGHLSADDAQQPVVQILADRGLVGREAEAASPTGSTQTEPVIDPSTIHVGDDDELVMPAPVLLACGHDGFEHVDHDGRVRIRLSAHELFAVASFRGAPTMAAGYARHVAELGDQAMDRVGFDNLVNRALAAGILVRFDSGDPAHARDARAAEQMRDSMQRMAAVHAEFDRLEAEHDRTGAAIGQPRVIGYHTPWGSPPASLGMVLAAALAHQDGQLAERYDFRPRLCWDAPRLARAAQGDPAIFLFSNYVWSTPDNLASAQALKDADPRHLTIHGGPDTPKYPHDVERWFREHPQVDVAVHGEGEATFCELLDALGSGPDGSFDLSGLAEVPGLSFRTPDGVVQTAARDRIADLDSLPSPVLTGLFDGFIPAGGERAGLILETNRGCPYGCTFCDWGSATLSRIRQFDLDRVFAELDWCAEHHLGIGIADANFGIFERDVAIAEHIVALKAEHGFPKVVGNNYAKNTVKHLSKIIDLFTQAGIVAEGKMSMQSFDTETLHTIRRKNIKVERYHDLAVEFRRNRLPLAVELMVGLPGSTPASFRDDLQSCIDRDLRAAAYPTVLLPNSPMNEPAYRAEHGIVAEPGQELDQTSSYTRDEYAGMMRLRNAFYLFENFGVLRQVASHVRQQTGRREIDFYARLVDDVRLDPERWPTMTVATQVLPEVMVPPVSWAWFLAEVRGYLVDVVGVVDGTALATVLAVQHALIPARGRRFPAEVQLEHDYVGWHQAVSELRDQGHYDDWQALVAPLSSFGPGALRVEDPLNSCGVELGFPCAWINYYDNAWDMSSPVSRPRQAAPTELAGSST